ncbi:MAG TPA: NADH-ubiquinone oxidoreductase-F iron-sulfur binding region domain-containing protein [Aquihabitans sp.]|nr:NADH-ubiquinone oxidoreductase-F iron-sulfur binding region domain-containing protein [Aquihabitans sp.]
MSLTSRVLDLEPVADLAAYEAAGGGRALQVALEGGGDPVLAVLEASGLRGRGGAGFPTHRKWRSILDGLVPGASPVVVVNGAEGEPGSIKDRTLLRSNPYRTIEGALVAALVIGADTVVVATKAAFGREVARLRSAVAEIAASDDWPGIAIDIVEGPDAYLFGEETALLEVVEGREPFPRIAPPWRRGIDDPSGDPAQPLAIDEGPEDEAGVLSEPTLVNNVETFAHVAQIVANGPEWFRSVGTADSPGTIVCTVVGDVPRPGVAEVAMGTPLREVLEQVGGVRRIDEVRAVLPGVSAPMVGPDGLDTPLTYEDMTSLGSGLGSAGFIVVGAQTSPLAVAAGASRFLAVESCGQCTPCKQDGLSIASSLERLCRGEAGPKERRDVEDRLRTIDRGARCYLATQHLQVVSGLLEAFPEEVAAQERPGAESIEPALVAELVDIAVGPEGPEAHWDERQRDKQPDWGYGVDSGEAPADRIDQHDASAATPTS